MLIGVPKEPHERQTIVAATPDTAAKLIKLGFDVCVEAGAGTRASYPDAQYEQAGARITNAEEVWGADIVICLDVPPASALDQMKPGAILISRLNPGANPELLEGLKARNITALSMDAVPRISRAQSMDVRSSMANVGGYRAVIEAASAFGRLLAGQVTAAGKINPAQVYVIGAGVAGLAAIGIANSMGAVVSATDVRSDVADQVESLGATFVEIPVKQESSDGYAKEMTQDQQDLVLQVYANQAAKSDIIITTAQIPGRPSPLLLTKEAVLGMKPGSVIVDMGASAKGSNCELTEPGKVITTENGVTIIGYEDLPSRLPGQASQLYGQNIVNFFKLATPEKQGQLVLNQDDEVIRGVTVVLDGAITWPPPPTKVSATPKPKPAEATGAETADAAASATQAGSTPQPAWKRWWWKIALGVVAVSLIWLAPLEMANHFVVFACACVIGFYVITNVTHTLHTPLMSVTNAISGIIILGALLQIGSDNILITILSFIAIVIASINIFGGFLVTHRMLKMFQRSTED